MGAYEYNLYEPPEEAYPTELLIGGILYPINADFRVMLRIIKNTKRTDVDRESIKYRALQLFYTDQDKIPENAELYVYKFIGMFREPDEDDDPNERPAMDYFVDAEAIKTGFWRLYGIDLQRIPFLHWFEFSQLLRDLRSTTAYENRVDIRLQDEKSYEGESLSKLLKAKRSVAIKLSPEQEDSIQREHAKMFARSFLGVNVDG